MMTWTALLLFGSFGIAIRFGLDQLLPSEPGEFPRATFLINLAGCLLAGVIAGLASLRAPELAWLRTGLLAGFCGGFTTFSAFGLQNAWMIERQHWGTLAAYALGSVVLGIAAAAGGLALTRY